MPTAVGAMIVALAGCTSATTPKSSASAPAQSHVMTTTSAAPSPPIVPTRSVAAASIESLLQREHANSASRNSVCAEYVATAAEISRLQYHGAPVRQVDPALEATNDLECIYARHVGLATSLFRVYVRRASANDAPPAVSGEYAVTSNGLRLETLADDTGDGDFSLGIGGDVAREFMLAVAMRIRR